LIWIEPNPLLKGIWEIVVILNLHAISITGLLAGAQTLL
jgi:hypothetical protein